MIGFDKALAATDVAMQHGIFNCAVLMPLCFLGAFFLWMLLWDLDKKQPKIRAELAERRAAVAAQMKEGQPGGPDHMTKNETCLPYSIHIDFLLKIFKIKPNHPHGPNETLEPKLYVNEI